MPRPNKIWFRKDTGWWMVTIAGKKVRLAEGRRNKKQAQQKFHELMLVRHQAPDDAAAPRVVDLIESFLAFAEKRYAPDTYRNYRFYGQKFAEACGRHLVTELKPYHVTKWIDGQQWNETTEGNARRVARRILSWAQQEGLTVTNPLAGMKCPRGSSRKRSLSSAEFRQVLAASHGSLRIIFWALRQTGARPCEARRLTWDQVRADRWILPQHKTVKRTQKPRVIYLTPPMQRLMQYLHRRSKSKYVFVNTRGLPWTTNALRLAMKRIKKQCALESDVCCYLIRHTFGTEAIVNGLSSSEVAELMGHASTEMIDRVYVHLADHVHHLQDAVCRATRALPTRSAVAQHRDAQTPTD